MCWQPFVGAFGLRRARIFPVLESMAVQCEFVTISGLLWHKSQHVLHPHPGHNGYCPHKIGSMFLLGSSESSQTTVNQSDVGASADRDSMFRVCAQTAETQQFTRQGSQSCAASAWRPQRPQLTWNRRQSRCHSVLPSVPTTKAITGQHVVHSAIFHYGTTDN